LNELDETTEVAFIFNPYLSPEELLRKINEDFGIDSKGATVRELVDELNDYLLDRNAKGKNCVLVIDEAQNLTPGVLEQIRLLSNLETETTKLMQIVLIGQPELMQHLSLDELRQLNQRITARYHLRPLERQETLQYIAYRLRVAGGRKRINFSPGAIKSIYKHSGGTPRVINAICDRALLIGYTKETREVSAKIVEQAWKEIRGEAVRKKKEKGSGLRRLVPSSTAIALAALILVAGKYGMDYWKQEQARRDLDDLIDGRNPISLSSPTAEARAPDLTLTPATERPVSVESPARDGMLDTTIAGFVDRLNPHECLKGSAIGMLRAWNLALLTDLPPDESVDSIRAFAEKSRLICESIEISLDHIEAINLPVMVRLHGNSQSVWAAITGIEFDVLRVTTSMSDTTLIPKAAFADCYRNEALLFWRDPTPDATILRPDATGEDVRVLQVQLRAMGRYKEKPNGVYDSATREAVAALQKDTGLEVDGVLGSRTRMVLYSWLPGFSTPALRPLPPLTLRADWEEKTEQPISKPRPEPKVETPKTVAKKVEEKPETPAPPAEPKPADKPKEEVKPAEPKSEEPKSEETDSVEPAPVVEDEDSAELTSDQGPGTSTPDADDASEVPPIPEGPIDPFADLDSGETVTSEELPAPGAESAEEPDQADSEQPDAPADADDATPDTAADAAVDADQSDAAKSEDSSDSESEKKPETASPSATATMPLVPSAANANGGTKDP
jgi:general secretion pathway protein A